MTSIHSVDKSLTSTVSTTSAPYTCYLGRIVCILHKICHTISDIYNRAILRIMRPSPEVPPLTVVPPKAAAPTTVLRHYLPRHSKIKKSHSPLHHITVPKALLQRTVDASSFSTTYFGAGMQNGGNTCYLAAVLQALRFVPSFHNHLAARNPLAKQIKQLFSHIEGSKTHPPIKLEATDTALFRKQCMTHGWQPDSEYSQEDPRQFCQFLLDKLGFPPFRFRTKIEHPLSLEVPSLERQGGLENYIELSLGEATDGTPLEQVAGNSFVMEEVEKAQIPLPEQADPVDFQRQLDSLADITMIPTQQTIQLTDIPQILPIALRRDRFDRETLTSSKATTMIVPSDILEFSLTENPEQKARYRLVSIVVRDGMSAYCGHCRTFIPIEGKYVEFNDSRSVLHLDPKPVDALICQHGLLFFYELLNVI